MVESSDKMSIGEGNGKPIQYCCLQYSYLENPMNSMGSPYMEDIPGENE